MGDTQASRGPDIAYRRYSVQEGASYSVCTDNTQAERGPDIVYR